MNATLLLAVKEHILAHPDKIDMQQWMEPCRTTACIAGWTVVLGNGCPIQAAFMQMVYDEIRDRNIDLLNFARRDVSNAYLVSAWMNESAKIGYEAARLLDITYEQAKSLFFVEQWPVHFVTRHYNLVHFDLVARTPFSGAYAQLVADVIDDFIAKHHVPEVSDAMEAEATRKVLLDAVHKYDASTQETPEEELVLV